MKSTTLLPLCVWECVCGLNFLLLHVIQYVAFVFSITLCHLTCGFCITSLSTVYSATCTVSYLYCNVLCDIKKGKKTKKRANQSPFPGWGSAWTKPDRNIWSEKHCTSFWSTCNKKGELTAEARRGLGCFDKIPAPSLTSEVMSRHTKKRHVTVWM